MQLSLFFLSLLGRIAKAADAKCLISLPIQRETGERGRVKCTKKTGDIETTERKNHDEDFAVLK